MTNRIYPTWAYAGGGPYRSVNMENIRELPDNLDDCHVRIVQLEDAVTREVETQWNLLQGMREKYEEEWVAERRSKAMVARLLKQIPREWIRKFIYENDPKFTTVMRSYLKQINGDDNWDDYNGEY